METKVFLEGTVEVFDKDKKNLKSELELERKRLLQTIGQQKIELDFLKDTLR